MYKSGKAIVVFLGLVILISSGCGLFNAGDTVTPTFESDELPTPVEEALATPARPETEPSPPPIGEAEEPGRLEQVVLTVWTLENFAPSAEVPGGDVLLEQLSAFDEAHPNIQLEIYTKRAAGPGSTLDYLRTAPPVAPGILPDLALLNQDSLVQATSESLLTPIGPLLDPGLLADLYPVAGTLGSVDEQLIGLPYTLEVRHTVYRQTLFVDAPNSFDLILDSPTPYNFAIGATSSVNQVTLLQYIAAGGELTDEEGTPLIDANVLASVLSFYNTAREAGVLDPAIFQYTDVSETWALYRDGQIGLAEVSSTLYLGERDQVRSTGVTWTPTPSGEPFALARAWSWVIITRDPERQQAALALLNFLMEPANQGAYTSAAHYLPSQRSALAVWGRDDPYSDFANILLNNARAMPSPTLLATIGPPMQNAVEDVLLNQVAPVQAAVAAAQTLNPTESTP